MIYPGILNIRLYIVTQYFLNINALGKTHLYQTRMYVLKRRHRPEAQVAAADTLMHFLQ